jgi:nucleotide-binding universal stress UspA family protein
MFGPPFVEIVRYAREAQATMIVMSTHGRSGLTHMLMGSTTEAVVRKASCPVLSIRNPEMRFEMP